MCNLILQLLILNDEKTGFNLTRTSRNQKYLPQRHKGYIYYSFFVPWCLNGRMEKVLPQKAQNLQLSA
jgi:hypothetical protein